VQDSCFPFGSLEGHFSFTLSSMSRFFDSLSSISFVRFPSPLECLLSSSRANSDSRDGVLSKTTHGPHPLHAVVRVLASFSKHFQTAPPSFMSWPILFLYTANFRDEGRPWKTHYSSPLLFVLRLRPLPLLLKKSFSIFAPFFFIHQRAFSHSTRRFFNVIRSSLRLFQ